MKRIGQDKKHERDERSQRHFLLLKARSKQTHEKKCEGRLRLTFKCLKKDDTADPSLDLLFGGILTTLTHDVFNDKMLASLGGTDPTEQSELDATTMSSGGK